MTEGFTRTLQSEPVRVQLRRTKGWRIPENTVVVARPTKWGNPFTKGLAIESGYADATTWRPFVVECFRDWIGPSQSGRDWWQGSESDRRRRVFIEDIGQLRGKNLACWCPPGPCHADVLLRLANAPADAREQREHSSPTKVAGTDPGNTNNTPQPLDMSTLPPAKGKP